jgi:multisubunit Na+/H+ antiporter MnhG subunit
MSSLAARIKNLLPYLLFALIYLLIAAVTFHFISRAGYNFYLSLAGSLLWPLVLFVVLGAGN